MSRGGPCATKTGSCYAFASIVCAGPSQQQQEEKKSTQATKAFQDDDSYRREPTGCSRMNGLVPISGIKTSLRNRNFSILHAHRQYGISSTLRQSLNDQSIVCIRAHHIITKEIWQDQSHPPQQWNKAHVRLWSLANGDHTSCRAWRSISESRKYGT